MQAMMKILSVLLMVLGCSSTLHAASLTIKVQSPPEWSEEAVHFSSNKGHIAIYSVNLSSKQIQNLHTIKKGNCLIIAAKDQDLSPDNGVIAIMDFQTSKKVACK